VILAAERDLTGALLDLVTAVLVMGTWCERPAGWPPGVSPGSPSVFRAGRLPASKPEWAIRDRWNTSTVAGRSRSLVCLNYRLCRCPAVSGTAARSWP
jgi:hypothetical protein